MSANEPAYPVDCASQTYSGLTKRELFAAMAMQGISAHPELGHEGFEMIASMAADQADALLAQLSKEPT